MTEGKRLHFLWSGFVYFQSLFTFPFPPRFESTRQSTTSYHLFFVSSFSRRFAVKRYLKHGDSNEIFQNGIKSRGVGWPMLLSFTLSALPSACTLKMHYPCTQTSTCSACLVVCLGEHVYKHYTEYARVLPDEMDSIDIGGRRFLFRLILGFLQIGNSGPALYLRQSEKPMPWLRPAYDTLTVWVRRTRNKVQCTKEYGVHKEDSTIRGGRWCKRAI